MRGVRLGIDVGSVRIGLAASDPDGLLATPVATIARVPGVGVGAAEVSTDLALIAAEAGDRGAAVVYVGLPRHLSGAEGAAARDARSFAQALARLVAPVPVQLVDERMTTVSAHQALRAAGREGRRHREVVDQAAAVIILQAALEAERACGSWAGERVAGDDGTHGIGAQTDDTEVATHDRKGTSITGDGLVADRAATTKDRQR